MEGCCRRRHRRVEKFVKTLYKEEKLEILMNQVRNINQWWKSESYRLTTVKWN